MVRGKIIAIGQHFEGVSRTKGTPWKKQEYVLETDEQYPTKLAFYVMNDKIDTANIQIGQTVEIELKASSREYNGRWYTEITAWKVNNIGFVGGTTSPQTESRPVYQQQPPQGYQASQYSQHAKQTDSTMPF